MALRPVTRGGAAALCLMGLLRASAASAESDAPESSTAPLAVTIDPSCKGFVFDQVRLEEDVLLEIGEPRAVTPALEVRCTEDFHAHVSERLEGVVLEQTLDLSSLPPSSWHRVLVLSFAEGAAALGARASQGELRGERSDQARGSSAAAKPPAAGKGDGSKKSTAPEPGGSTSEAPSFGPSDLGGEEEDGSRALREIWLFGGGAGRITEQGGMVGATLGVRYRPLFVGVSILFGESSEASLSTAFLACSLTPGSQERWSPLVVPRISGGLLSRAGAMEGGAYYAAYFDAGLWLGATLRVADQWVLSGGFDGGYGLPTTVNGKGGSARAGGGFVGGVLMLGARP